MDNNFNQQAPQQMPSQQVPQQQMYQQAPQQQMYQQPMYQPAPKKPMNIKEMLALICSAAGAFFGILGATLTCSCSASKTAKSSDGYSLSAVFIVAILAACVAAAGVVLAIMALKEKDAAVKAGKLSYIAIAVGIFGVLYALIPTITICGYNCSLQSNMEDLKNTLGSLF